MTKLKANCCLTIVGASWFMKRASLYLVVIVLLFSCAPQNKSTETTETLKTTAEQTAGRDTTVNPTTNIEEEDCVFNNDYKGLTTDWLKELKIETIIWRDDLKQALVPKGQDTVFLQQGGCTHSGFVVEWKLTHDQHFITDSAYWITKALELSAEYQMDHYEQMIREGKIKKVESGEMNVWYEIEDNNEDDNLIYNGIEITQDGHSKRINISQYFN
jgi:hypothetical protein